MLTALQALASAYVEALQRCTEPQTSQQAASTHSMPSQKEPSTETDKSAAGVRSKPPTLRSKPYTKAVSSLVPVNVSIFV